MPRRTLRLRLWDVHVQFLAYAREDGLEHRLGETTGLRILSARMVGGHQEHAIWERRDRVMPEMGTCVRQW